VKDWLRTENQDSRVQLTLAAEQVWAWLKGGELKNVCCQTLDELTQQVQQALFGAHRPDGNHSALFHTSRGSFLLKINSRLYNGIAAKASSPASWSKFLVVLAI
jgi:hypothetical protein